MKQLEKNVWLDDVKVVYEVSYTSCEGNATFLTKEDAIQYINKYKKELLEEYDKEWMAEEGLDGDAEDYIEEIELDPKHTRVATDENGNVILERLRFGEWVDYKWWLC